MKDIDVMYLYEHSARELDVACAVKCLAERKYGLKIELQHYRMGINRSFSNYRPRIVVLPHCYALRYYNSIVMEWRKSIFFNISWEQLLNKETRIQKRPSDEFSRKHVIHHAWGDFFAKYLKKAGVPSENIFVNGNPSYVLFEEPYQRYFKSRQILARQFKLDLEKKWILFPENFGHAFVSDEFLKTTYVDRGVSFNEVNTMREFACKSLEYSLNWCASIASDKNLELIIRPRPAIPLSKFVDRAHKILGVIPNGMHFIKEESIREWIMASDLVISSYSTCLVDAAFANKAAYMIEPYPVPNFLHSDWHDYIDHIRTQEEFINICKNNYLPTENNKLGMWARDLMYARGDAIQNLAGFFAQLCSGEIQKPPTVSRKLITRYGRFRIPKWALFEYRKLKTKKNRRKGNHVDAENFYENEYNAEREIDQRIKKWAKILNSYEQRFNKNGGRNLNKIKDDTASEIQ